MTLPVFLWENSKGRVAPKQIKRTWSGSSDPCFLSQCFGEQSLPSRKTLMRQELKGGNGVEIWVWASSKASSSSCSQVLEMRVLFPQEYMSARPCLGFARKPMRWFFPWGWSSHGGFSARFCRAASVEGVKRLL